MLVDVCPRDPVPLLSHRRKHKMFRLLSLQEVRAATPCAVPVEASLVTRRPLLSAPVHPEVIVEASETDVIAVQKQGNMDFYSTVRVSVGQ